jgi:Na+/phosphate symporter
LRPLQDEPFFRQWLGLASAPWIGILSGIAATALLQSSTVTAGLAIILVQQGALPPQAAIPIVIGATIGTTSTALVASLTMTPAARATAFANLTLCAFTALLYFPLLQPFAEWITSFAHDAAQAVAWAQTIFNLSVALLCLAILDYIGPQFERWMSLSRPA